MGTFAVGLCDLRNATVFATGAHKLEEILEKCDELIFALAVGEEEGEEDGEVAGADHDVFGELLGEMSGVPGVLGEILNGGAAAE